MTTDDKIINSKLVIPGKTEIIKHRQISEIGVLRGNLYGQQ